MIRSPRFPIELFKANLAAQAVKCGLSEPLDFESFLDSTLSWQENLSIFHKQYPRLAEGSDLARIKTGKAFSREYNDFQKRTIRKPRVQQARKDWEIEQVYCDVSSPVNYPGLLAFRRRWNL
jgi:hypothetical protein